MKQLLLLAVSLTLSSVMLAQNPCLDQGKTALTQYFDDLSKNQDLEVGDPISVCLFISPDPNNPGVGTPPLSFGGVSGYSSTQGAIANLSFYTETGTSPLVDNYSFEGDIPLTDINGTVGATFGLTGTFTGEGSFTIQYQRGNSPLKEYTVTIGAAVAPVTWTSPLAARPFGENLQLSFSVADQVDVAGYELERAVGTQPFAKVADIDYVENGSLEVDYSVSTAWVREGSYYRIKQLDFAGTYDYSNVIFVEGNDGAKQRFQMFPNPASDFVRMSLPAEVTSVDLISASGQLLRSAPASQVNRDGLDVRGVSPGLYLVRPVGGDQPSQPQRLVVNH